MSAAEQLDERAHPRFPREGWEPPALTTCPATHKDMSPAPAIACEREPGHGGHHRSGRTLWWTKGGGR